MGYAADSQSIRELFLANWATAQPDVPLAYPDTKFDPPKNSAWARLTILTGAETQVSMGKLRRFRRLGIVDVGLFLPLGSGDGQAKLLADSVASVLRGRTVGNMVFRAVSLQRVGIDGAHVHYAASTPYQSDELITNPN